MGKLSIDFAVNNSEFIEKINQMRSIIQVTAREMEEQGQKMSSSYQQMTDSVSLNASVVEKVVKNMMEQINASIASLNKLDFENQASLMNLRDKLGKTSESATNGQTQEVAVGQEISIRESLSEDIKNQSDQLMQFYEMLQDCLQKLGMIITEEMDQLSNAGQEIADIYVALQEKSNSLNASMMDMGEDSVYKGILTGLNGISGALSMATSMSVLFSTENEELRRVMEKVQAAIAFTNGLQQVHIALSKESAFRLNVVGKIKLWWRAITLQAAAAQGIETAATSAATVVNGGFALSFRAIGLAIKSIPGIGWILTGITALLGLYTVWSAKTKEQGVNQKQLNEDVKDFNQGIQDYAARPVTMITLLSAKFKALGNDMEAQRKFITDNKKAFDELGFSINTVKDAQQLLIDNKEKFIEAQIAKAASLEYEDAVKKEIKNYIEAQTTAEKWHKISEEEDKKSMQNTGGVPINTRKRPLNKIEYDLSLKQGLLNEEGYYYRPSEIKENAANNRKEESRTKIKGLIEKSLSESQKAAEILAEITPKTPERKDNTNKAKEAHEAHEEYMKLLEKQKDERIRFAEDSENRIQQTEIDAKAKGLEKNFEQLKLNQKKEKQALEREKKELIRQRIEEEKKIFDAKEKSEMANDPNHTRREFDASTVNLQDINKEFEGRSENLDKKQLNERLAYYASERKAMEDYLKDYASFAEKREAIRALGEKRREGRSSNEVTEIDKETNNQLADLDIQAAESSAAFGELFSNVKDRSVKDMRAIINQAQAALDFIKGGAWDAAKGVEFGITEDTFNTLKNSSSEMEKIEQNIKDLNQQASASQTAFGKMGDGFNKLFNADSDPKKTKEALDEIEGAMKGVNQSVQFFSNSLSSLGDSFGNETMSGIADGMNVAMDAASSAMSGAQAGAALGPWGAAAGAAIGLVSSLSSSLAKLHDAKHEKSIQRIQEQIEVLEKSYENLGDSLDKAFSSDASELIEQQNTLLEQQKVLIQNQIEEEKSKKKTDWGRIEGWEKQIEDINKMIGENKEKQIDAIMGGDLKSAIEDFAQAYADAWSAGDDRAKSSKDLVKNMIKQMITEAIKAASSKPMEDLRKKLASFFSDGIISDWERQQIEKDAEAIANDLDRQFGWADEYMKGDEKESSSQESTKGGFETMSQETGDELNGRFTALQISNEEIKNSMVFILSNLSSLCIYSSSNNLLLTEMRNLAVMSNGHLEDIAKYTKVLLGFGDKLDNIAYNTKSLTVK